jgi:hypothetical protein
MPRFESQYTIIYRGYGLHLGREWKLSFKKIKIMNWECIFLFSYNCPYGKPAFPPLRKVFYLWEGCLSNGTGLLSCSSYNYFIYNSKFLSAYCGNSSEADSLHFLFWIFEVPSVLLLTRTFFCFTKALYFHMLMHHVQLSYLKLKETELW